LLYNDDDISYCHNAEISFSFIYVVQQVLIADDPSTFCRGESAATPERRKQYAANRQGKGEENY
jgi:hypothetical protein